MPIVIDIGTTTVTAALIDGGGNILARAAEMNAQRGFGAEVISRLRAAESGKLPQLRDAIRSQIDRLCKAMLGGRRVESAVIVGNTVMLHLLFGADCDRLGTFPYTPDFLEAREERGAFFGWDWTDKVLTPPGFHAFCGADITAGLVNSQFTIHNSQLSLPYLLADLGTNAELALVTQSGLFVTSAAAGPVFEGAGLSCGMPALPGAVCGFSLIGEKPQAVTVGGKEPVGICASGLIDILAELRRRYRLKPDGLLSEPFRLAPGISVTQQDVRAFQLAKAAVAAGITLLCARAGVEARELNIAVSGALGSALNFTNAVMLGLFGKEFLSAHRRGREPYGPIDLSARSSSGVAGNSALSGAIKYALGGGAREHAEKITRAGEYVDLSLLPEFQQTLLDNMDFPGNV